VRVRVKPLLLGDGLFATRPRRAFFRFGGASIRLKLAARARSRVSDAS
jgi:hypothetical protein